MFVAIDDVYKAAKGLSTRVVADLPVTGGVVRQPHLSSLLTSRHPLVLTSADGTEPEVFLCLQTGLFVCFCVVKLVMRQTETRSTHKIKTKTICVNADVEQ